MPQIPGSSLSEKLYKEERNPDYLVIKGNSVVQNSHYSMPLIDQKILASLIRSIKPGQKSLTVKFSTNQFVSMLGLKGSGTNFDNVLFALKRLADESFYIKRRNGKYVLWRWLGQIVADPNAKGRGNFLVPFQPYLRKYLFSQSIKYRTIYKFSDIMLMRSRYSPRLYEIFRSNQSRQKVQKRGLNYSLKELKYSLNLMYRRNNGRIWKDKDGHIKFKYPRLADFRRRVLRPAVKEINLLTENNVRISPIKHGRKVVGMNVVMLKKNKDQKIKRDDIIYCITHHIPKSQWKNWREDKIRGRFHKVNSHKKKIVNGKFHVIKGRNTKLKKYLHKHPIPMRIVNIGGGKVYYYNPLIHKYVWTSKRIHEKQARIYSMQKELIKQMKDQK